MRPPREATPQLTDWKQQNWCDLMPWLYILFSPGGRSKHEMFQAYIAVDSCGGQSQVSSKQAIFKINTWRHKWDCNSNVNDCTMYTAPGSFELMRHAGTFSWKAHVSIFQPRLRLWCWFKSHALAFCVGHSMTRPSARHSQRSMRNWAMQGQSLMSWIGTFWVPCKQFSHVSKTSSLQTRLACIRSRISVQ